MMLKSATLTIVPPSALYSRPRGAARFARRLAFALGVSLLHISAFGQKTTTTWNTTQNSWFNGAAWTGGIPNSFVDYTMINNAGTVQVTNGNASAQYVYLGSTVDTSGTLEVMNGGRATFTTIVVGGLVGTGTLRVLDGGSLTSFGGPIGSDYMGTGSAMIDGLNSLWRIISSETVVGVNGGGTLRVQNGGTFTVGGGNGRIQLANHPVASGTLEIGSGGAAGIINAAEVYNGEGAATLLFNHTDANYIFAPRISGFGTTAGSFTLRHEGPGTTVLTAASTMAGETVVTNGTLIVNGSISGSLEPVIDEDGETIIGYVEITGAISATEGGTLGGSGFLRGKTTVGGTLSPGTSAGILSFGDDLTLTDTGAVVIELGGRLRGSQYDGVDIDGILTLAGGLYIAFINGFTPSLNDTFSLFDGYSAVTGAFDQIIFSDPRFDGVFDPASGMLTITAIPEPNASALAMLVLTLQALRRRRKA